MAQKFITHSLYENYNRYKQESLKFKRIKHKSIEQLIQSLEESNSLTIEEIGKSIEGRSINLVKWGEGDVKILAWSQMHGDESTATMALFDIFNFLTADDNFNDFRNELRSKITLYAIPMLNPDGAEKYERENAVFIDLNRDALRLQSPESQALKSLRDKINPEFGFNLHDQLTRYAAGKNFKQATISFLAPPFNYEREMNEVRAKTMKVIVDIYKELQAYIPGHIGKWSDEFEPRAFGDNMVKWGTSSVLIESGGWYDDNEKQYIRKLNFVALLTGFYSIGSRLYEKNNISVYESIPENNKIIYDLVLRKLSYTYKGQKFIIDVAIQNNEENIGKSSKFFYSSSIEDIGDLSTFYGIEDVDLEGYSIELGKTFKKEFENILDIKKLSDSEIIELYRKGYTSLVVNKIEKNKNFTTVPFNIRNSSGSKPEFGPSKNPEFVIKKNGKVKYVVINGFLYNLETESGKISNGLIIN